MPTIPLSTLNGYTSSDDLVSAIGSIYEHSPWISSSTFSSAPPPYSSLTALHTSLKATVSAATQEQKLNLVNAHPDLAGKAALSNSLTAESASVQVSSLCPDWTKTSPHPPPPLTPSC
jgi:allantoate deiminase/N-carbamoyl-L-amino-acid hydrolase